MAKPVLKPSWLTGYAGPNSVEPSGGKKAAGWVADERPPAEYMNFLFQNLSDWIDYVDTLPTIASIYKAVVGTVVAGSPATHATLAAALADVAVPNGSRILILESQALAAPVTITKNFIEIEFAGNVSLSKTGGASALIIQGLNCRIKGGRIAGYSGGADKAIEVQAAAKNCMLRDIVFSNCTTDVNDLSTNTSIEGCITEE